ncbi:MAG TPA: DUF447 family protein [Methanothrix sp.]|jgi:hypothetical protein|nr:DUF447 family protein [Methanothrix sp.]HPC88885.1 DUF447 family protein [Methanothrix sp.]HQE86662.1 DUF447 family protein [Methanothrix sp.]HQI67192.1 DUF447 family protein [Methanothrix sp.]HRS84216.1 DUF447 family protein [Methanothrix sp.]
MLYGNAGLDELGILDGINEIIATTETRGRVNAAPLGIIREGDSLYVRLFLGSHTYENVLTRGWFVANVSHDSWLFAETALEDLPQEHFTRREGLPILKDAEAWGLFKCEAFATDIIIANVELVRGEVLRKDFRAVNRGANLVVEAAVAATRYMALRTDSYFEDLMRMQRIINRCGGPREREAMDRLMERIDSYAHIR